jgi:quinol monooxygenase YgiN
MLTRVSGMVRLTVAIKVTPRQERDVLDALRFIKLGTLLEPGCLTCTAWTEPDSTVHYVEEWASEADLRRHVRSDRFTSLLGILETGAEAPRVQFHFVSQTRGLEYAAELRDEVD